ncbi:hypothetical protein CY34DRAFT_300698 [Suillus luteus UH-Slu-Lm8-n1]|uniref:Uncharacterized protein n=1 Tax=Suillus luteus UH-Slu-Lm8-n1 TaxID=930992 RepID=A0A0D0AZU8_9AGAM|nr:hypothetical protein CY34DRAFT_300698 [Suillus luteus UH-Slu-Lm8-n1]
MFCSYREQVTHASLGMVQCSHRYVERQPHRCQPRLSRLYASVSSSSCWQFLVFYSHLSLRHQEMDLSRCCTTRQKSHHSEVMLKSQIMAWRQMESEEILQSADWAHCCILTRPKLAI